MGLADRRYKEENESTRLEWCRWFVWRALGNCGLSVLSDSAVWFISIIDSFGLHLRCLRLLEIITVVLAVRRWIQREWTGRESKLQALPNRRHVTQPFERESCCFIPLENTKIPVNRTLLHVDACITALLPSKWSNAVCIREVARSDVANWQIDRGPIVHTGARH